MKKDKYARQYQLFEESVRRWYTPDRWDEAYPYISGELFSRRFIEHFITEYARSHRCEYPLEDEFSGEVINFNVYHSAQTVLTGVHKRHMDPFGRRNRVAENGGKFMFGFGEKMWEVSVCELVFFRWALKHGVLAYAKEHHDEIKKDMVEMARFKRGERRIEEVIIEMPEPQTQVAVPVHPLQDEYWQDSTRERKQQPKKKRRRYRNSAVNMVMNNDCEVTASFQAGGGGEHQLPLHEQVA